MDASDLAQQVDNGIDQLHCLFDEIGLSNHERQARESELFVALSESINSFLRAVTAEKKELINEAKRIIIEIRQMETSLQDPRHGRDLAQEEEFKIAYPLARCLQVLREKHAHVARLHKERFEQVMKLVETLESYSSHLEPTFVQITLPPTGPNRSIPLTFDLSPSFVSRLDSEFTRVYEEYSRRLAAVQALGEHIITLWSDLGIPQSQQDAAIVKYHREAPEQLGLHEQDIKRLSARRDKLSEEKKSRERRLRDLRSAVVLLWGKLEVDETEQQAFLSRNEGCGIRQIHELEDELERLNELKRKNLHFFIEDARVTLQSLWDALYFSEDEMLEFTPAFSDVYSDALLDAHEREVARLTALKEQRAGMLALVDKHKGLIKDREELIASSQDSSRLMLRGQKGEKRDPGKLLREEKMRKRIAKELPRVTVELKKALEGWEGECGLPFLVYGERYLDEIETEEETTKKPATSRTRTPAPASASTPAATARSGLVKANPPKSVPPRSLHKTPGTNGTAKRVQAQSGVSVRGNGSPAKAARIPLSNLKNGVNSPGRGQQKSLGKPQSEGKREVFGEGAPRAPPPKMRSLKPVPELNAAPRIIRAVDPEDVYEDGPQVRAAASLTSLSRWSQRDMAPPPLPPARLTSTTACESVAAHCPRPASSTSYAGSSTSHPRPASSTSLAGSSTSHCPRQASTTSLASGSENWETYDDDSEPEADVSSTYYSKLRAARRKRTVPEQGHVMTSGQTKRMRGFAAYAGGMVDEEGRVVSGSEWADEDTF